MNVPDGDYLLLIDASAYIHRGFHASARTVRRSDNQETGAIINFCWALLKMLRLNRTMIGRLPSHAAIVMDVRGPNFRHEMYPEYKAHREGYDPALESQLPFIPTIADAFGVQCIAIPGFEADDVIATYAELAQQSGLNVVIASSDKDLCQLVSARVIMYDAMKDKDPERFDTSASIVDIDAVKDKWGVFPWQFVDLQAIMGDKVDNVPGVPSIGPKKAAVLVNAFGSVEAMLDDADFGEADRFKNEKEMNLIAEHADAVRISKLLVELDRNVPVELSIDDLYIGGTDTRKLKEFFMSIEAPQLERRVDF